MSEYSESYHLESDSQQDGVALLRKAKRAGFVFPSERGWVSLAVATPQPFEPDLKLVGASRGLLLHFLNAEDEGWGWSMFENGRGRGRYLARWGWDFTVHARDVPTARLVELASRRGADPADAERTFDRIHAISSLDELVAHANRPPAYQFAEALSLPHYSWVSYRFVRDHYDAPPGTIEVDAPSG